MRRDATAVLLWKVRAIRTLRCRCARLHPCARCVSVRAARINPTSAACHDQERIHKAGRMVPVKRKGDRSGHPCLPLSNAPERHRFVAGDERRLKTQTVLTPTNHFHGLHGAARGRIPGGEAVPPLFRCGTCTRAVTPLRSGSPVSAPQHSGPGKFRVARRARG